MDQDYIQINAVALWFKQMIICGVMAVLIYGKPRKTSQMDQDTWLVGTMVLAFNGTVFFKVRQENQLINEKGNKHLLDTFEVVCIFIGFYALITWIALNWEAIWTN